MELVACGQRFSPADNQLPTLAELGTDLLETTRWQRALALGRPFMGLAAFCLATFWDAWWATPFIVFLIFVAVVTVTHDVVHNALGISSVQTDVALLVLGALLFESGHAYRVTHRQHHHVFPGADDPEGEPARMPLWRAVIWGPAFLPTLWWWAFRRQRECRRERVWLLLEAGWFVAGMVGAATLWRSLPAFSMYFTLAIVGSWVYPLLTVHLPHRNYGDSPLTQTHTLRGWIIPKLFLELTYHLEHHLYPRVPSHNLPKLSSRLEPSFRQAGVRPIRVP